jgi:hypothetical protein
MEIKELHRSAALILIYIILLALVKVSSVEPLTEKDQALSQSSEQESVESANYLYYPELKMYYSPIESLYIYFDEGRWVSQKSLPTKYREIKLKELQYLSVEDIAAEESAYITVSEF